MIRYLCHVEIMYVWYCTSTNSCEQEVFDPPILDIGSHGWVGGYSHQLHIAVGQPESWPSRHQLCELLQMLQKNIHLHL